MQQLVLALVIVIYKYILMKNTTAVGNSAETLACEYLEGKGYKIVGRNYKDRFCEIDIVACNKDYIVFVEVKYRSRADYGGAAGAVTPAKLAQMTRAAEFYLSQHQEFNNHQPRLDVVTISGDLSRAELEHIENCTE